MKTLNLKLGELFVGAGGLGVGFTLADHPFIRFQPIFAVDNDKPSLQSYRTNLEWLRFHTPLLDGSLCRIIRRDIEKLKVRPLLRYSGLKQDELDILIGGPPCQGYSSSNRTRKKEAKGNRNRLTAVFLEKVIALRPKTFLLENVQGVQWTSPTENMTIDGIPQTLPLFAEEPTGDVSLTSVQQYVIKKAKAAGYCVWYDVIDSAEFGVPQYRNRFFLFGVRRDLISDDTTVDLNTYLKQFRVSQYVTVGEAIDDLPEVKNGSNFTGTYKPGGNGYVALMRQFMNNDQLFDHFTTNHNDVVIARYKKIKPGENWEAIKDLMTNYANVENTHSNIYRRLRSDLPANTITHYRKSMIIHPRQHRGLSFREACRLQSFPDWFRFSGGREEMQQQLANAVPPLLAQRVGYAIAQFWVDHLVKNSSVAEDIS